jgi:3-phenylpropionate/cinnamic acid dioxygenase small subunit
VRTSLGLALIALIAFHTLARPADRTRAGADSLGHAMDELDIRNVIHRLAQLADEGTLEDYAALFTEDGVWDGGAFGLRKGTADLVAGGRERRAKGLAGPGTHKRHVITTTAVSVEGDRARARSYMLFYVDCDKQPRVGSVAVYQDEFRRTDSGWKLAHRSIEPA